MCVYMAYVSRVGSEVGEPLGIPQHAHEGQKTMACSLLSLSTFVQGVPLPAEPSCWPLLLLLLLLFSFQVLLLLLFACLF